MTGSRPRFTVVTAVYNVEPYLPAFMASIEEQRFDLARVEIIAVDDGSTDGSLALLEAWAARRPELVKVLSQPNGGQGSARNLGIEHATGEWVTFTDPDDELDRGFLDVADRFATSHPDVEVLSSKPMLLEERAGRLSDTHPRRAQFTGGNRRVNLDQEPNAFTGSATVSLFRLDRMNELGIRFDERIQPNFEDGHFAVCYLLGLRKPVVGLLRDARYIYRKRATLDSTLQRSLAHPGRYGDVFRFGYLDVIDRARGRYGEVPEWLQHVLIYELSWYLSADEGPSTDIRMSSEMVPVFHDLFAQVIRTLDPVVVGRHTARPLKSVWADIFAHGGRSRAWHSPAVARTRVDPVMGLQRINYRFVGDPPIESFDLNGAATQPAFAKTMEHIYGGGTLMHERVVWVRQGPNLRVQLDGKPARVRNGWPEPGPKVRTTSLRERLWLHGSNLLRAAGSAITRTGRRWLIRISGSVLPAIARSRPFRSAFRDAWVLMDRIDNADDNGERLFDYLLQARPDINAWFVIEKGTADWDRLQAAGVPKVVAHGSFRWKMLMLNCAWLLSSHADVPIVRPRGIVRIVGEPTWRFAFLQHGVIKDDLSRWLNGKDIELFVTSTEAELGSIIGDGTGYVFTAKEVRNTGLPRFDRLLAKGRSVQPDDRDLVIVAPTWRSYLAMPTDRASHRRALNEALWDSDYLRHWRAILESPDVAQAVARRGWKLVFMPHPNMQPALPDIQLPDHVEPRSFDGSDVQGLYARCALLVTDYSSVAFNVAYLDAPVVYYQFDRDEVLGGGHLGRKGYFDYATDGFGPVATTASEATEAVVAAVGHGPRPMSEYQARIDATFVNRDGQACARVVAAIEELSRPYRPPAKRPVS